MKNITLAILLAIGLTSDSRGAILVESTFDTNDEGWLVGDFFFTGGTTSPTYVASSGNPGGFIQTFDIYDWNAYHAPSAFLGNKSGAFGGNLHLEQRVLLSDGSTYPMVVISDGTLNLQFQTAPPGTDWTSYDIPLVAAAGWEVALNSSGAPGPAATDAELLAVLSNLLYLHIDADWYTGGDQVDLDNVRLESQGAGGVPEPASFSVWAVLAFMVIGRLAFTAGARALAGQQMGSNVRTA